VGQKSKPPTDLLRNRIKTCRQSYFFVKVLKLNVEQATKVNVNKHLLVLNILSIKCSVYDVKRDINYCGVYFATTNASEYLLLRTTDYLILEAAQSCKQLDIRCCRPELVYMQNNSAFLTYEAIYW